MFLNFFSLSLLRHDVSGPKVYKAIDRIVHKGKVNDADHTALRRARTGAPADPAEPEWSARACTGRQRHVASRSSHQPWRATRLVTGDWPVACSVEAIAAYYETRCIDIMSPRVAQSSSSSSSSKRTCRCR